MVLSSAAVAQVDTYRAGAPYSAVPASSPDQCVAACTGDAACKGWNFVRLRPAAKGGAAVCEFLGRDAVPLPSAGSVSGAAPHAVKSGAAAAGSRLVRSAPKPAVRVGQPAPVTSSVRRDVRPVPQQAVARPASRSVARPKSAARLQLGPRVTRPAPRFRHVLDGASQAALPQMALPQMARPSTAQPVAAPPASVPPMRSPFAKTAPQASAPQASAPQAPAPQASLSQTRPPQAASTPESLFGGLYDDVAVPAPLSPEAAENADAPIATAARVSVSGLAGGR